MSEKIRMCIVIYYISDVCVFVCMCVCVCVCVCVCALMYGNT